MRKLMDLRKGVIQIDLCITQSIACPCGPMVPIEDICSRAPMVTARPVCSEPGDVLNSETMVPIDNKFIIPGLGRVFPNRATAMEFLRNAVRSPHWTN